MRRATEWNAINERTVPLVGRRDQVRELAQAVVSRSYSSRSRIARFPAFVCRRHSALDLSRLVKQRQ
jgi:hypothetical protein